MGLIGLTFYEGRWFGKMSEYNTLLIASVSQVVYTPVSCSISKETNLWGYRRTTVWARKCAQRLEIAVSLLIWHGTAPIHTDSIFSSTLLL